MRVAWPWASWIAAPLALKRLTRNVSSGSSRVSPHTVIGICFRFSVEPKVSVKLFAPTKSTPGPLQEVPEVAVPPVVEKETVTDP